MMQLFPWKRAVVISLKTKIKEDWREKLKPETRTFWWIEEWWGGWIDLSPIKGMFKAASLTSSAFKTKRRNIAWDAGSLNNKDSLSCGNPPEVGLWPIMGCDPSFTKPGFYGKCECGVRWKDGMRCVCPCLLVCVSTVHAIIMLLWL